MLRSPLLVAIFPVAPATVPPLTSTLAAERVTLAPCSVTGMVPAFTLRSPVMLMFSAAVVLKLLFTFTSPLVLMFSAAVVLKPLFTASEVAFRLSVPTLLRLIGPSTVAGLAIMVSVAVVM